MQQNITLNEFIDELCSYKDKYGNCTLVTIVQAQGERDKLFNPYQILLLPEHKKNNETLVLRSMK